MPQKTQVVSKCLYRIHEYYFNHFKAKVSILAIRKRNKAKVSILLTYVIVLGMGTYNHSSFSYRGLLISLHIKTNTFKYQLDLIILLSKKLQN